ncbi:hypothetical protein [Propionibacterium cyclohexanicum]|uniref:hypothetical protein n=1 Tax=Propionibacterium cyclohexanicum TaxID=64702 RepID=UPI000B85E6B9|nr:hypothetical protein [Propionibacterium cyclohexanicum]
MSCVKWLAGLFDFEAGDGGVAGAGVVLGEPVPGDRLVRAGVVVVAPLGADLVNERESIVDLLARGL